MLALNLASHKCSLLFLGHVDVTHANFWAFAMELRIPLGDEEMVLPIMIRKEISTAELLTDRSHQVIS